ncbi:hypothetical protein CAEBREN_13430 [Caenorhabditis brenneri]|uniref:Uncharacterized protein n=1 Tax=Caenorhabditis brenneri TaxID=135651 RepID=G0ND13_CAEBE|nr:hypothetical protein CAEBREN_13430 [Caenorhabditis brenneri]
MPTLRTWTLHTMETGRWIVLGEDEGQRMSLAKTSKNFYSVAWCQQPSDILGALIIKIVVGDETGRLYVVDYETMKVERELQGLRGVCNEIRTNLQCPTLIAVASNDRAVRVWFGREEEDVERKIEMVRKEVEKDKGAVKEMEQDEFEDDNDDDEGVEIFIFYS